MNSAISAAAVQAAQNDGVVGNAYTFIVVGHGNATSLSDTDVAGGVDISPESVAATMAELHEPVGMPVDLFACNTGNENTIVQREISQDPTLPTSYWENDGNNGLNDFAQTLSNLTLGPVKAPLGYMVFDAQSTGNPVVNTSTGAYIIDNYQLSAAQSAEPSSQQLQTLQAQYNTDYKAALLTYQQTYGASAIPPPGLFGQVFGGSAQLFTPNDIPGYAKNDVGLYFNQLYDGP